MIGYNGLNNMMSNWGVGNGIGNVTQGYGMGNGLGNTVVNNYGWGNGLDNWLGGYNTGIPMSGYNPWNNVIGTPSVYGNNINVDGTPRTVFDMRGNVLSPNTSWQLPTGPYLSSSGRIGLRGLINHFTG